ncbi:hypothetical protein AB0878_28060 [Amycolatopsis sp. NPDC047767]|uniref:hypothetical protein n=1 Tax=Amycolatopsis sp. NPDC047767 TaxID=3156765 RepID=UPI003453D1AA
MNATRDVNAGQVGDRPVVLDSYGRLSWVLEAGELEKVETQWVDNRKVIDRVGATLAEEFKDGLCAWKRTAPILCEFESLERFANSHWTGFEATATGCR